MQQLLNFDTYTFRASSASKLMVEGSGKSGEEKLNDCLESIATKSAAIEKAVNKESKTCLKNKEELEVLKRKAIELKKRVNEKKPLSDTTIKYLIECYVSAKHGIKKDIHSKYFEKGKATEDVAIRFLEEVHDKLYDKCTLPRQYNEFIEGECDIRYFWGDEKTILDIKNSWSLFTFQPKTIEKINPDYEWQGICYLMLYNANKFNLVYCLMNMPDNLFEDECRSMLYKYGKDKEYSEEYMAAVLEFRKQCTFDHLPAKERIYDDIVIMRDEETEGKYAALCERIKDCRSWLNEYAKKEYIRCYGSLPEGVTLLKDEVNFVELVEVKEPVVEVKLAPISVLENNPEFIKHDGKSTLNEVIEAFQKLDDDVLRKSESFNNFVKETDFSLDNFHIINPDPVNNPQDENDGILRRTVVIEPENSTEKEEAILSGIKPLIAACTTRAQVLDLFEKNKDKYQSYTAIINEFSNKDKELLEKETLAYVFEDKQMSEETPPIVSDKTASILSDIENLKSEKDCIEKYKEIRGMFAEFPILKDKLTEKKESFKTVEVAPKPQAGPRPAPQPQKPVEEIKPISPVTVVVPENNDVDITELKQKFSECKTVDEVIELAKANAGLLKKNRELHQFAMLKGDELNKKS